LAEFYRQLLGYDYRPAHRCVGCPHGDPPFADADQEDQMTTTDDGASPSALIDAAIAKLGDWRGETLARVRALIHQAEPDVVETVKWRKPSNPDGVPVWELDGIICTGETYKDKVKITFAQGAALDDPAGVFNASLGAGTRRAIDLRDGDRLDEEAFCNLVAAAAAHNGGRA
jgi:hypothetical protein